MANNLTITGGSFGAGGKFGNALTFTGTNNSSVAVSTGRIPASGTFSVEGWIKRNGNPSHLELPIAQCHAFWIGITTSGYLQANYGDGSPNVTLNTTSVVTDNTWHHVEIVIGSAGCKLYLDGTQVATNSTSDSAAAVSRTGGSQNSFFSLGDFNPYSGSFAYGGSVDEVAIWNIDRGGQVPSSPYAGTESGMTNLYHLTSDGTDSYVGNATVVSRNAPGITYSPLTWDDDGTNKIANSNGSYVKFNFTGTSLTVNIAAMATLTTYPMFRAYIDAMPAIDITPSAGQTTLAFATGLASGTHTAKIVLKGTSLYGRWDATGGLNINGFSIDSGATISAPTGAIAPQPKVMAVWGDSISEGERVYGSAAPPAASDGTRTLWWLIAEAFNCELAQMGYGAQGYELAGAGGVPSYLNAYATYNNAGRSRISGGLYVTQPDYIFDFHGQNGTVVQSDVATMISNHRAAAPNAIIFMCVAITGGARAAKTAATNAAISAGDTKLFLIDLASVPNYALGFTNDGSSTEESVDAVHPYDRSNARLAARMGSLVQHIIEPRRFTVIGS